MTYKDYTLNKSYSVWKRKVFYAYLNDKSKNQLQLVYQKEIHFTEVKAMQHLETIYLEDGKSLQIEITDLAPFANQITSLPYSYGTIIHKALKLNKSFVKLSELQ